MRALFSFVAVALFSVTHAAAATFSYNMKIDSISGPGAARNLGFYIEHVVGDTGTLSVQTLSNPLAPIPALTNINVPGKSNGGTASVASFNYDPGTGILIQKGPLGGFTGAWSDFFPSPNYAFSFQGQRNLLLLTGASPNQAAYDSFFSTVNSVSGFVTALFDTAGPSSPRVAQTITFSTPTTPTLVPLPAGGVLLLSGLGLLALRRRKSCAPD